MPPARRSKQVLKKAADQPSFAKRRHKPRTSSLAAFDASRPPPKQSKGKSRRRKQKKLSNLPSPELPSPPSRPSARETAIKINTSPLPPSFPGTSTTTTTLFTKIIKQYRKQPPPPPFDLTYVFDKDPYHISIYITPNMEGKRKDKDQILLRLNLNDLDRASFFDLQADFYNEYVKEWIEARGLTGANILTKLYWSVTTGNVKGNHQTIRVKDQKL
jgi:hypothetical protein